MRSCLLSVILLALVAANGYTIWQVRSMRATIEELRAESEASERGDRVSSLADYARDAAEAMGRGEVDRAAADLRSLEDALTDTKEAADQQREKLLEQVRAAREAVSRGRDQAKDEIERLVRMLSSSRRE
jgi:hypothetical protein